MHRIDIFFNIALLLFISTLSSVTAYSKQLESQTSIPKANWFFNISAGPLFPLSNNDIKINNDSNFPALFNTDIYTINQSIAGLINFTIGRRWKQKKQWFPAYSLGLFYQHSFSNNINGSVIQNSVPEFSNYNYHWNLSSDILLGTFKLNICSHNWFSPFIMVGLGGVYNHANYREVALAGVSPRISPEFSGNKGQFAYNVGTGLDFDLSTHLIVNIAYIYQNLGSVSGQGVGSWSNTSLHIDSYKANELLIGITYLLDK